MFGSNEPQSQHKSSAADAQQSKDGSGKQCNILRYCAAQQQLWGTHSCGKLATLASDRTGLRRKAPREHRGKCCGRVQQPRVQLTESLWEVPPAFAYRGSRAPPRSSACRLLPSRRNLLYRSHFDFSFRCGYRTNRNFSARLDSGMLSQKKNSKDR